MSERRLLPGYATIYEMDPPRDPVRWEGSDESAQPEDVPVVLMEATPEGVGPFTEQMLHDLNTAIFRLEGKWPTDSEADRLREVQTAIRRVLDAGANDER